VGRWVQPGSVDLAYLDPPFCVDKTFGARITPAASSEQAPPAEARRERGPIAYSDVWPSLEAYLAWLEPRVQAVRDCLSDRGTMWLHLDYRAVHEAKIICDKIYGRRAFRGEVIWVPGNGSKTTKGPALAHQTLLLYAKGRDALWNGRDPALREPYAATSQSMHFTNVDSTGRRYRERSVGGKTYRYFADEGRAIGSVWTDCPSMVANTPLRAETTGYPTQKPLKLLDRIIRATSNPGSLVLDPFAGSGTTLAAAAAAGRHFVGIDRGELAIATCRSRLEAIGATYNFISMHSTQCSTLVGHGHAVQSTAEVQRS